MDEIFRSDKLLKFWPTNTQSATERVYATTRFIIYLSVILYILRRDVRILVLGAVSLFALYYMYKNGMIPEPEMEYKQGATKENIFNNGMGVGPPDSRTLKSEWDKVHPYMEGRWFSEHNFYTAPVWESPDFINNAYAGMFVPKCRDNPAFCDPDSKWGRGPEHIHLRGQTGNVRTS
jgi:hypothetical protein